MFSLCALAFRSKAFLLRHGIGWLYKMRRRNAADGFRISEQHATSATSLHWGRGTSAKNAGRLTWRECTKCTS